MPRRKLRSDAEVLSLALEVLIEKGPHKVTLPDVGRATGLSPSTLIQRFGSKQKLVERLLRHSTELLSQNIERIPELADSREGLLLWLRDAARSLATRDQVAGNLALLMEDITLDDRRRDAKAHMNEFRRGIRRWLSGLGSKDPRQHTDLLEAHYHGLIIQWALHGRGSLGQHLDRGMGRLLDSLGL